MRHENLYLGKYSNQNLSNSKISENETLSQMKFLLNPKAIWTRLDMPKFIFVFRKFHIYYGIATKTYLYNFDPLKPHFYIVNWGLQGYTLFFLFLLNIDCGYSLEPPRRGGSNEYPQSMFLSRNVNYQNFFI